MTHLLELRNFKTKNEWPRAYKDICRSCILFRLSIIAVYQRLVTPPKTPYESQNLLPQRRFANMYIRVPQSTHTTALLHANMQKQTSSDKHIKKHTCKQMQPHLLSLKFPRGHLHFGHLLSHIAVFIMVLEIIRFWLVELQMHNNSWS